MLLSSLISSQPCTPLVLIQNVTLRCFSSALYYSVLRPADVKIAIVQQRMVQRFATRLVMGEYARYDYLDSTQVPIPCYPQENTVV